MVKFVICPIPTSCSSWPNGYNKHWPNEGGRCPKTATLWLIDPDGQKNPGGYVCEEHGRSLVKEFQEKTGEVWTLVPIVQTPEQTP